MERGQARGKSGQLVRFSPDNQAVAVAYGRVVKILSGGKGELLHTLDCDGGSANYLVFRDGGKHLDAFATRAKHVRWNWKSGERVGIGKATFLGYFKPFGFSRDGEKFHANGSRATLYRAGGRVEIPTGKTSICGLAMSGDGKTMATGFEDGSVKLWNVADKRLLLTFQAESFTKGVDRYPRVTDIALCRDGSVVATGMEEGGNRIRLWNIARAADGTARAVEVLPDNSHRAGIKSLRFARDGKRLMSTSIDETVRLWDVATRESLRQWRHCYSAAMSADGTMLAVNQWDHILVTRILNIRDIKQTKILDSVPSRSGAAISPDGKWLAYTNTNTPATIILHDILAKKLAGQVDWKATSPNLLAFSPDSRSLAFVASDGAICVGDMTSRKHRLLAKAPANYIALKFSPDGRFLITGRYGQQRDGSQPIQVWNLMTGKRESAFGGDVRLTSFVVTADSLRVAGGCADGIIHIWDLASGEQLNSFDGGLTPVYALAINADGSKFASGSGDSAIFLWDGRLLAAPPSGDESK